MPPYGSNPASRVTPEPLLTLITTLLCVISLGSCAQQLSDPAHPGGPDDPGDQGAGRVGPVETGLRLLPENTRYFQYRGLPMVLFGHQAGLAPTPVATFGPEKIAAAARYGNSMFTAIHPEWVRATHGELLASLQDDAHWEHLEELARTAFEHGVVLHLYFWSYKWDYETESFTKTDMLWPDPSEEGGEVTNGWTRRDLHELAIERVVEATWQYPNVVYDFMWEYNTRRSLDPEGDFHRWWVERLKAEGREVDPEVTHLISLTDGRPLPGDESASFGTEDDADFIVEEDGNGFWYSCETGREEVLGYEVPLVFISSDYPFADNDFSDWEDVPYCGRERINGSSVSAYRIEPDDVRDMLKGGFHPAEAWAPAQSETLDYYLQARWYMENVGVLDTSLDAELTEVPPFRPSERPLLENPEGYSNGRDGETYAAIYRHPQGHAPAQAEVWIDVDGDGRFSPDPAAGERFRMEAQGDDYAAGVLFTAQGPSEASYVFRFAGKNWNPPETGGLVPGQSEGISYGHWNDD